MNIFFYSDIFHKWIKLQLHCENIFILISRSLSVSLSSSNETWHAYLMHRHSFRSILIKKYLSENASEIEHWTKSKIESEESSRKKRESFINNKKNSMKNEQCFTKGFLQMKMLPNSKGTYQNRDQYYVNVMVVQNDYYQRKSWKQFKFLFFSLSLSFCSKFTRSFITYVSTYPDIIIWNGWRKTNNPRIFLTTVE